MASDTPSCGAMTMLSEDRLYPVDTLSRSIARNVYDGTKDQPIVSPHGHTDPYWFAKSAPFPDPAQFGVIPDH